MKGSCAQHLDEDSTCNSSILTTTLGRSDTLYSHFTVEETKAEKLVNLPRSHSWQECGAVGFGMLSLH